MYRYILGAHVIASSLPPFLTLPPSLFAHPSLPSCLPLRLAPSCRLRLPAQAALRVQHVRKEQCVNSAKTYKRDGSRSGKWEGEFLRVLCIRTPYFVHLYVDMNSLRIWTDGELLQWFAFTAPLLTCHINVT